ncbi:MAG: GIY-YIG nuclease family protein [Chitinophagales bacterium]
MWFVYIIHSQSLDRYYIGETDDVETRLRKHRARHRGYKWSMPDWELKLLEAFTTKKEARIREKQLKNWKNRKRIEELIARSSVN